MAITQTTDAHPIPLSTGDWHVAPARSELGFLTRIIFGLIAVRGRYSGFDGELHIDGAGNASGVLRVEAETISTGIKKRDTHLRSTDFFAVEHHPHLTFELTALTPNADGSVRLTGTLHIRDRASRSIPPSPWPQWAQTDCASTPTSRSTTTPPALRSRGFRAPFASRPR